MSSLIRQRRRPPSFPLNFARNASESEYPELWEDAVLLVAPGLGYQGHTLQDWTNKNIIGTIIQESTTGGEGWCAQPAHPYFPGGQGQINFQFNRAGTGGGHEYVEMAALASAGANGGVPALDLLKNFTYMAWGRMLIINGTQYSMIFSKGAATTGGTQEQYSLYIKSSTNANLTTAQLEYRSGGATRTLLWSLPANVIPQAWHHYAIVIGDGTATFYLDGLTPTITPVNPTQTITAGLTSWPGPMYLAGAREFNTTPWIGWLDDFRVYKRALSPQEIFIAANSYLTPYQLPGRILGRAAGTPDQFVTITPAQQQWQASTPSITKSFALQPSRQQFQAQTPFNLSRNGSITPSRQQWKTQTLGAIKNSLTVSPALQQWKVNPFAHTIVISPAQMQWRAIYNYPMAGPQNVALTNGAWGIRANDPIIRKNILAYLDQNPITIYANTVTQTTTQRTFTTKSLVRMAWQAQTVLIVQDVHPRDCGETYTAALANYFIAGDWLIQIPSLDVRYSFHFEDNIHTWSHKLRNISDIEISAPFGGGMASVANVTFEVLEDGIYPSIAQLWDQPPTVNGVEVTIDFILDGIGTSLRFFTGVIDNISITDGVSSILCVDHSILQNLQIPQTLMEAETFPNADSGVLTQPEPLVYGQGAHGGAVPLLLIDILTATYLVAGHKMTLGSELAVFETQTNTYMALPNIIALPTQSTNTITLGTIDTGTMTVQEQLSVQNAEGAVDGLSNTLALVGTGLLDSNGLDGIGYLGITPGGAGYPRTDTIQLTLTNHRRSPGSDPTTGGTFIVRTLDPATNTILRTLYTSPTYKHVTSAQTDVVTISSVAIALNELLEVYLLARNEGSASSTSATYEVGEISITPLVAYSANISGAITAVNIGVNVQELRFNQVSLPRTINYSDGQASNAAYAIDDVSTTLAILQTSSIDSNFDGVGQLVIATSSSETQRGNNTAIIDLVNHRRGPLSDPTTSGTFYARTINPATGQTLRDNLFVTPTFRHVTHPQSTSFVITSLNLGANEQLAVRMLARNEGGAGGNNNYYEVGEINIRSFYQARGDNALYLFGAGWEGRRDPDGSVTHYANLGAGTLLTNPDQVIASILLQECLLPIDEDSFAQAYSFYVRKRLFFDGGIGAKWSVNRANARDILQALAFQSTSILTPTFSGGWALIPYRPDTPSRQSFDVDNILATEGAESQPADQHNSTFQVTLGNMQQVHNRFEVHYAYNVANAKYDKVWRIDETGSNLENVQGREVLESLVFQSFYRYGKLEPLIVQAYWIQDDDTALYLLNFIVSYFSQPRVIVQFETTFGALCLQVGDFITVSYPALPEHENNKKYQIHTLRYMPTKGRIQIIASTAPTLSNLIRISPYQISAMRWQSVGVNAEQSITLQPAKMQYTAVGSSITLLALTENWEFLPVFAPQIIYAEQWVN